MVTGESSPPVVLSDVQHELTLVHQSEIYSLQLVHELQRGSDMAQIARMLGVTEDIQLFPPLHLAAEKRAQNDWLMTLAEILKPKTEEFLALLSFHSNLPVVQTHSFRRNLRFMETVESAHRLKALQIVPVDLLPNGSWCVAAPLIPSETHIQRVIEILGAERVYLTLTTPESLRKAWKEFEELQ